MWKVKILDMNDINTIYTHIVKKPIKVDNYANLKKAKENNELKPDQ